MKRGKPIPGVNRARRARRKPEQFARQAELCRQLPCAACGSSVRTDPAHVQGVGAGGRDRGNVIPLCSSDPASGHEGCHQAQHQRGWGALYRSLNVPPMRSAGGDQSTHTLAWAQGLALGLEVAAYGAWV